MPRARPPRSDPGSEIAPEERARIVAVLEGRFRELHRTLMRKKWQSRRRQRALGLPSIGLPPIQTTGPNVTPRYGRNNPLRYQRTNESDDRLDQSGSRL